MAKFNSLIGLEKISENSLTSFQNQQKINNNYDNKGKIHNENNI